MIFKFALRNLVRFPWRTLLYAFIIFFIIVAMTASFFVWNACEVASDTLHEDYMFVASLVKRVPQGVPLSEVFKCLEHEKVTAFNVTLSDFNYTEYATNAALPTGKILTDGMIDKKEGEVPKVTFQDYACEIYGVENLALVYPFFSGECRIREGSIFTRKGYSGEIAEILIPWYVADAYDIEVGDVIYRRYWRIVGSPGYLYMPTTVVGIYESSKSVSDRSAYPAYIPLSIAEMDYAEVSSVYHTTVEDFTVDRADFVLESRDDFESFVRFASAAEVDFQSANIVFNNSTYDVLVSELNNVNMIALLVLGIVFVVGLGIFIFFTVYLCNSRTKERVLLSSLGMKRIHIHGMIALELCIVIVCSVLLGLGVGQVTASKVCGFINDTVLARASVSEEIQEINSAEDFEITMPLEKNMKIQLFAKDADISENTIALHKIETLQENEIGVSKQRLYFYQTTAELNQYKYPEIEPVEEYEAKIKRDRAPFDFIGISDMSYFELTDLYDDIPENAICCYVSEDSPFVDEEIIFVFRYNVGDCIYNDMYASEISKAFYLHDISFAITGTYKPNEYVAGNDVIMSLEDYYRIFAKLSITDDEHYFKRIGEIYIKEETE